MSGYRAMLCPWMSIKEAVIDGDTVDFLVYTGLDNWQLERARLEEVDTHETHFVPVNSEEYELGKEEERWVESWFSVAREGMKTSDEDGRHPFRLLLGTEPRGKYGRLLCKVERIADREILNDRLIEEFEDVNYD